MTSRLWAESEEELKNLLIKVKEESGKTGLITRVKIIHLNFHLLIGMVL